MRPRPRFQVRNRGGPGTGAVWLVGIPLAIIVIYGALWVRAVAREKRDKAFTLRNLGNAFYTQGKYEEAAAYYTESLRLNPEDADAHNNFGGVLYAQGNFDKAKSHFARALQLNPRLADAHYNLASVLRRQGKSEEAEALLIEAIRLNPGFTDARNTLGLILFAQSRYAEAEAHFAEAIRLDPSNFHAHYNLGLVLSELGKFADAKAKFAEAIRLQPSDPNAYAYTAIATLMAACPDAKLRDGKGAVKFATRACELTGWKYPLCLSTLAMAHAEAGDFNAAVSTQKKGIELLTDERQKDDYRSRLVLYQAKKPFHQVSAQASDGSTADKLTSILAGALPSNVFAQASQGSTADKHPANKPLLEQSPRPSGGSMADKQLSPPAGAKPVQKVP